MNTYAWSFDNFEVAEKEGDLANVVKVITWHLTATDEKGRSESASDRLGMDAVDPKDFTPFEKLTKDEVQGWVEKNPALDVPAIKAALDAKLAAPIPKAPPALVTMAAPFEDAT